MNHKLILVSNPGSASRKYALYDEKELVASIHFEYKENTVVYSLHQPGQPVVETQTNMNHLTFAASKIDQIFTKHKIYDSNTQVCAIGLRVVAPSSYFQSHRILDSAAIKHLRGLQDRAVLHINATLQEYELLSKVYKHAPFIGASDSSFHQTMPTHTRSYALPQKIAKQLDVWRFGYHGLSVSSVVEQLKKDGQLRKKVVICHLGSGVSVTALLNGKTLDTTMGYSPLEGVMMATRSGSIDPTAAEVIRKGLGYTHDKIQQFLNISSGLVGVSGSSSDIRSLLKQEAAHDTQAELALDMYVMRTVQAIGSMSATLGGIESLVFTGTVGQRSPQIRTRIAAHLRYLGLYIDPTANRNSVDPTNICLISHDDHPSRILVAPTSEDSQIRDIVDTLQSKS